MSTMDRSFIGAGSIYLKPADDSAPLLPVGNVSEFKFSFEEDKKELKNYLGGIDNLGVTVSYTASNMVQALIESGKEFVLFMEGLNDAQDGKASNIRVHRIKFSPVQNLDFISDDFASIPLEIDVLVDTTITGSGLSTFMQIDLAG
ncbi:hypothetical protein [Endozoicomonas sp. GU-1]|uniref:hypothetical protein n=1 Tax=Endozoicomonas sp. GU-1 TaxID=3009078 RepID=UPI0022B5ACA4|nr:hypothetical protein [Endozoicomonas sp. GU-1]WBA79775.1 hypothetical protein O2T12_15545 [Endozoicomonas sp. GU-1]WBA87357.1 hypothetical protein O3276_04810 [Endozoicomonas sp. GU-1]